MTTLLVALGFIFSATIADAQQEDDLTKGCIQTADLKEIANKFDQFGRYVNTDKEKVCSAELGSDNYQIAASLNLLRKSSPNEPEIKEDDAFTYRAIEEKNWWGYFTKRSSKLIIDNNCEPNVVAYVFGFSNNGAVYLCRPYFESNRSTQASVLMHEARHFDGHRHVACTRGNEEGNSGACDNRVSQKGSYAISLQTLVGLSRDEQTSEEERLLLESEAVYTAFNKFNKIPQLKMTDYVYLSNDQAEVFMWNVNGETAPKKVAQLNEPAIIQNSFNKFTIYPVDTNVKAYRMGRAFKQRVANPGLYAVHFNELTPEERGEYVSIVYFGDGGLLTKGNNLQTLCNGQDLATKNLDRIDDFSRIITLAESDTDPALKSHLLAKSGDIYELSCQSRQSSKVNINKVNVTFDARIAENVVESFTVSGSQFALLNDGSIIGLSLNGSTYSQADVALPAENRGFIGATPLSVAEIFE